MKNRIAFFALVLLLGGCSHMRENIQPIRGLVEFSTEAAAQRHCPKDSIVWVDNISGVYHAKGEEWYGRIFGSGGYVCRGDAIRSPYTRAGHGIND